MNKKKIIYLILACIIVAGIIITAVAGLNINVKYKSNKQLEIYINQQFEISDIKQIVKEVLGNEQIIVQKVEAYDDIVSIVAKDITEDQAKEINAKINEKYGLENTMDDVEIFENPNLKISSLVKPYIISIAVSLAIIIVYAGFRFKNVDILEVLGEVLGLNIFAQLLYMSILAIVRIQVNSLTMPTVIAIYAIITLLVFNDLETKNRKIIKEEKK